MLEVGGRKKAGGRRKEFSLSPPSPCPLVLPSLTPHQLIEYKKNDDLIVTTVKTFKHP